jgi:2-dehydropantoate 2-reductase
VLAQNGIGIEAEYAVAYPNNTIISGVVYLPTTQVEPGIIEHGTPLERFEIGTYPASSGVDAKAKADQLAELFAKGDGTCIPHDDIQAQRWYKLALNAAFNPVTALTLCDDANLIRSSEGALEMLKDIMREVGATAKAYGYENIDETSIAEQMVRHEERLITGGKEPSMLVDVRHERAVEVEAILGNVVRMAKIKKVEVPLLSMLYVLTKARNFSICKPNEWEAIARVE